VVILTTCKRIVAAASCGVAMACGNGRLDAFEVQKSGLIDDFEDLNNHSAYDLGWWYIVNDHSGSQMFEFKAPADRPGDQGALHSTGSGFTGWGAEVGVSFDRPYDARRFSAVEFIAEAGASGANPAMNVWILDPNHSFSYGAPLTSTWSTSRVPFADGVSPDDSSLRLDTSQIMGIQFAFDDNPSAFDVWLDDVSFAVGP
jgi:hypothetical protein